LQIIKPTGIVNYIMPVKWTNAAFGKGLRQVVSEKRAASKIVNFGAYQVFNASTYTALQWFVPSSDNLRYFELDRNLNTNQELGKYLTTLSCEQGADISSSKLSASPWGLTVGKNSTILNLIEQHTRTIGDVFDKIFQGIATSKDDVYFLYDCVDDDDTVTGFSKQMNRTITIERGLVKPLLKGEDVHRYDNISTDRYVIFPYKLENGKAILFTEDELSKLYPNGYTYLKECEDILRNREKGRFDIDGEWFQYGRKQGILFAERIKLVAPEISLGGNFAYDINGKFYSTTKIYGYIKKDNITESYKFWLGLFNSKLFWFYIQHTGYVLRGGYFTFKTNYVTPFPVPNQLPYEIVHTVEVLTDYIMFVKSSAEPISDLVSNKFISDYCERIIDGCIFELYFPKHMQENGLDIATAASQLIQPIDHLTTAEEKRSLIWNVFTQIKKTDNQVRNRLELFSLRSPDILKPIIEG